MTGFDWENVKTIARVKLKNDVLLVNGKVLPLVLRLFEENKVSTVKEICALFPRDVIWFTNIELEKLK